MVLLVPFVPCLFRIIHSLFLSYLLVNDLNKDFSINNNNNNKKKTSMLRKQWAYFLMPFILFQSFLVTVISFEDSKNVFEELLSHERLV